MIKILSIVGARPQFVKASAISRVILNNFKDEIEEIIVHTGQHYDENMSFSFFEELKIPKPKYNLEISGGKHGYMTGRMIEAIEKVLIIEKPDWVLLYGDTNSTLAGAISAAKLNIRIVHIEAGLRSFNMKMPEEINRILTDRVSSLLFCPTTSAVSNLKKEGVVKGVHNVGDVMYDVALFYEKLSKKTSKIKSKINLKEQDKFILATVHRAENTDDPNKLKEVLIALAEMSKNNPIVFPIHPRTLKLINDYKFNHLLENIIVLPPLSFLEMIDLEKSSSLIITDSGGVQKEAFFYKTRCLTIRDETEWIETIESGANKLISADSNSIVKEAKLILNSNTKVQFQDKPYGDGNAALDILTTIINYS